MENSSRWFSPSIIFRSLSSLFVFSVLSVFSVCSVVNAAGHEHATTAPAGYEQARAKLDEQLKELRQAYQATQWPAQTPAEIGAALKHYPQACQAFIRSSCRFE